MFLCACYPSWLHGVLEYAYEGIKEYGFDDSREFCALFRYLDILPPPARVDTPSDPFYRARPCLAVIPCEETHSQASGSFDGLVQFYSFKSHTFVHALTFQTRVLSLRTSKRMIVVAVDAQVHHAFQVVLFRAGQRH